MSRYTGPKRRLSRREKLPLFAKDAKSLERKGAVPPGQHIRKFAKKLSGYGLQLREKQKSKRMYGLSERQMRKYFKIASKKKTNRGFALLELLERRLDNIVYRLGFASSRAGSRQLVNHGHILVDGKKTTIPSFQIKENQTIALPPDLSDNIQIKKSISDISTLPAWLERKATVGKVLRMPDRQEMEQTIDEQLIVEYYSR